VRPSRRTVHEMRAAVKARRFAFEGFYAFAFMR
jgi:hypothetical protein